MLMSLLAAGMSMRMAAMKAGVHYDTARRRAGKMRSAYSAAGRCDGCKRPLTDDRERTRRWRGFQRKFCSLTCYWTFRRGQKSGQRCRACNRLRIEASTKGTLSRGLCPRCYSGLQKCGYDEGLFESVRLTKRLALEANVDAL
jgi:hypothetical protein